MTGRPERVAALLLPGSGPTDETQLWELLNDYNWDDGIRGPLAVVVASPL